MLSQKKILSVTHIVKKMPDLACDYLHGSALTNHFSVLSSYHTVFSKEVVTKGRLIICTDPNFCKTFVMHTLSMYAKLNQERGKIIERYTA
jgi:hypothetical protein